MNERHASMVPVGLVLATMFSRPGMGTVIGGLPVEKILPANTYVSSCCQP